MVSLPNPSLRAQWKCPNHIELSDCFPPGAPRPLPRPSSRILYKGWQACETHIANCGLGPRKHSHLHCKMSPGTVGVTLRDFLRSIRPKKRGIWSSRQATNSHNLMTLHHPGGGGVVCAPSPFYNQSFLQSNFFTITFL